MDSTGWARIESSYLVTICRRSAVRTRIEMRSVTTEQGPLAMELMQEVLEGGRPEPRELIETLVVQETTRMEKRTRIPGGKM